ncbi:hypothetical protein ACOSQ2_005139 [Xanthoceras sorbifolium]
MDPNVDKYGPCTIQSVAADTPIINEVDHVTSKMAESWKRFKREPIGKEGNLTGVSLVQLGKRPYLIGTEVEDSHLKVKLRKDEWQQPFPNLIVTHLDLWYSDHRPILLQIKDIAIDAHVERRKLSHFHYEEALADDPDYNSLIRANWNLFDNIQTFKALSDAIYACNRFLHTWNTSKLKKFRKTIKQHRETLHDLNHNISSHS